MAQIDIENTNKLKKYSNQLTKRVYEVKDKKNNVIQINNLNLDIRDSTNCAIYRKVKQLNLSIDNLTNLLEDLSVKSQKISTKLSVMK